MGDASSISRCGSAPTSTGNKPSLRQPATASARRGGGSSAKRTRHPSRAESGARHQALLRASSRPPAARVPGGAVGRAHRHFERAASMRSTLRSNEPRSACCTFETTDQHPVSSPRFWLLLEAGKANAWWRLRPCSRAGDLVQHNFAFHRSCQGQYLVPSTSKAATVQTRGLSRRHRAHTAFREMKKTQAHLERGLPPATTRHWVSVSLRSLPVCSRAYWVDRDPERKPLTVFDGRWPIRIEDVAS